MATFKAATVLITGGANGIGKLLGKKALEVGAARLIIWDTNASALNEIRHQWTTQHQEIYTHVVDMSDENAIYKTTETVLRDVGQVDILINNVGIVQGRWFHELEPEVIKRTMQVNTLAAMHTTRAFLPTMMEQDSGHIVNISSATSLMANPKMAVYAASKWAVTGWSESLRLEMQQLNTNIMVTTVQPSYISTGMFEGVRPPLLTPILSTERITNDIIRAIQQDKILLRRPFMVKLIPLLQGILPARWFDFIAGKLFRVYSSMDTFKGRKSPKP